MGSWRKAPRGYWVAIALLTLIVISALCQAVAGRTADDRLGAGIAGAVYGGILLIVCGVAHDRVRRSFVFELTDRTFSVTRLTPWGPLSTRTWPRSAIGGVCAGASGGLIIRITGKDLVELWLGPDRLANERTAAALCEGLAGNAGQTLGALPPGDADDMPRPMPPGNARTAMLVTAAALALAGLAVGLFLNLAIAIGVLLVAAIPAGIALGTQKKDFYP